ncbi:hypothetical protein ACJ73_04358 [Blastomyces percursus]|uniref:Uncharacterized protein n=1 Tax=Blastomyces percursus TaxID=1658174 RepID=A0A1J9R9E3_9EURO|nr:hypothetical protein ACJ73_04358 [Blastomyces percursus]
MVLYNRIIQKVSVGKVVQAGTEITVSVATKTSDWDRPVSVAQQQGPRFLEAVEEKKADLPAGTKDVCQREAEHPSDSDPRDHFTGVCWDGQKGTSMHFPIKK